MELKAFLRTSSGKFSGRNKGNFPINSSLKLLAAIIIAGIVAFYIIPVLLGLSGVSACKPVVEMIGNTMADPHSRSVIPC